MSKNKNFDELARLLTEQNVSEDELIKALFIIRAHYDLAGIVLVCRRLSELLAMYPALRQDPAFPDLNERITVLAKIANLENTKHFESETTNKNKSMATPLRPHTGDSSLCDLLLIKYGINKPDDFGSINFDWITTWFVWQTFHFQVKVYSIERYKEYITGDGDSSLKLKDGGRIYSAFKSIRQLGSVIKGETQDEIVENLKKLSDVKKLLNHFDRKSSLNAAKILKKLKQDMREDDKSLEEVDRTLYDIYLFLAQIWSGSEIKTNNKKRKYLIARVKKKQKKLGLIRYGSTYSQFNRIDNSDSLHTGLFAEIHRSILDDVNSRDFVTGLDDLNDEPKELSVEPEVMFFLSDGKDLLKGFYAAKSALHHIESGNAGIRWPRWRLSHAAKAHVLSHIKYDETDSLMYQIAKLAIGLSLLSGRSIFDVSKPVFVNAYDDPKLVDQIGIITSSMVLSVPAGTPKLKSFTATSNPFPKFCFLWHRTLCLPLPESIHILVAKIEMSHKEVKHVRQETIEKHANVFLKKMEGHFEITSKAIQNALKLELNDYSKGDLAVIKAITDASGMNYDNLIHYASFNKNKLEELWRKCIESWGIQLPSLSLPSIQDECVGSPFGIDKNKVAKAINEFKVRFNQAIESNVLIEIVNQMTVYTILWLNLATAGRRARNPFPKFISNDGWALIRDKHREDESTDRYLPLTEGMRRQIQALRTLMTVLGISHIEFEKAVEQCTNRVSPLIFNRDHDYLINAFAPRMISEIPELSSLSGNWGRKLVRSAQDSSLSGRFKDAGLGHWVRGRHPWTSTSAFPSALFKQEWLTMQEDLEKELGFDLFNIKTLSGLPQPNYSLPNKDQDQSEKPSKEYSEKEIEDMLSKSKYREYYNENLKPPVPSEDVALELGIKFLGDLATDQSVNIPAVAKRYCEIIRNKTKFPLYAEVPRSRFQKNWLVSEYDFGSWCYVEQHLLPAIKRDLSKLPSAESEPNLKIAMGRLLVAASLYAGIYKSSHLEVLMEFLASEKPLVAIGSSRMIELKVTCIYSKSRIRRTLLLTPFLSTLLLVERGRVREVNRDLTQYKKTPNAAYWESCFKDYLKFLKLPKQINLKQWLDALKQNLMLTGSPLIAAYAAGEILSEDLPISELQRLSRYEINTPAEIMQIDETSEGEDGLNIQTMILPEVVQKVRTLRKKCEDDFAVWEKIFSINISVENTATQILSHYGKYMLEGFRKDPESEVLQLITKRMRGLIEEHITIVAAGFVGFSGTDTSVIQFDEEDLQRLSELTAGYFPAKKHQGAWNSFRKFLSQSNEFKSGRIAENTGSRVSAKVFSKAEVYQIIEQLNSIKSGIGNPELRKTAQMHFQLVAGTGTRRSEAEHIRRLDIDGSMLRIRPYSGHTLKTVGSERVFPTRILDQNILNTLYNANGEGEQRVINTLDSTVTGDNFFNGVSRLISKVTRDADLGMHHLRHTFASAYTLKTLGNSIDLSLLNEDLPWVKDWIPSDEQLSELLGPERQCGQGLKAISGTLGHIHETTTLRHYIHIFFAALHSYHLAQEHPRIHIAFKKRDIGRSGLQGHNKLLKEKIDHPEQRIRELRNYIENYLQKKINTPLIFHSKKNIENLHDTNPNISIPKSAEQLLSQFENMEKHLLFTTDIEPDNSEKWVEGLKLLAEIPTGKRGSNKPRHPLPIPGKLCNLPQPLNAVIAFDHALKLLSWLIHLQNNKYDDFKWLIDKWLHDSTAEKGTMRINSEEKQKVENISEDANEYGSVYFQISQKDNSDDQISKKDNSDHFRIRIDRENTLTKREAGAVRWIMTWMSVKQMVDSFIPEEKIILKS